MGTGAVSVSQNSCALGWPRSPSFLLQKPGLLDDTASVVWASDWPVSLKQKGYHTGLVRLPGHSPPSSRAHREVQCCEHAVLWACGTLARACFGPSPSRPWLARRSQLTGWLTEYVPLVYFAHRLVTTLGEEAACRRGWCFSSLGARLCQSTNCFPPVTVNCPHVFGQPGGKVSGDKEAPEF